MKGFLLIGEWKNSNEACEKKIISPQSTGERIFKVFILWG
jgi:hypothetical protein